MILSEFAGAAQSLNGSIVVNPWDSQEVADAIYEAVTMDAETRAENHRKLFKVCPFLFYLASCSARGETLTPPPLSAGACSTSTSTRPRSGARRSSGR